ncbi:hypothetical protein [Brochothrix thermosphacta]|uniref:Gram-positive cocci surface proteins LPxTG domain-containing protein n=1 Tax=Brochothrix thermosphacta TaxID=2756 RepID=A0A2X0QL37_BROTH|nr:hypothetical protein [Brochothrix thermosphacta]SPP29359.1 exported hypothetical protein [Brochothrix thermosphacta]
MKKKIFQSFGSLILFMILIPTVVLAVDYPSSTTARVNAGISFHGDNYKPEPIHPKPTQVNNNNTTSQSDNGLPSRLPTTGGGSKSTVANYLLPLIMMSAGFTLIIRKKRQ